MLLAIEFDPLLQMIVIGFGMGMAHQKDRCAYTTDPADGPLEDREALDLWHGSAAATHILLIKKGSASELEDRLISFQQMICWQEEQETISTLAFAFDGEQMLHALS